MTTSLPVFVASRLCQKSLHGKIRGISLLLVLALHLGVGMWLIHAKQSPQKTPPKVIEVVMLPPPEKPKVPQPPAPPIVKKEVVKPVVKPPEPVKKVIPPKPIAQPKLLTSASEKAETSTPKVDTTAMPVQTVPTPPAVTKATAKPAEVAAPSNGDSISGGECDNCQSIERRLKRKNERWRLEGATTFVLSINENGQVIDATLKSVEPDTMDADTLAEIKEIVVEMEFTPKIVNEKPVAFKGTKTLKFQIQK